MSEKNIPTCKDHDEKMKAFYSPDDPDYDEFMEHLNEKGKELVGLFKKVTDPQIALRVYYFDIESEETYPIIRVEFKWG